ncbi:OmpA family protein [Bordetella sp. 2513F-2]
MGSRLACLGPRLALAMMLGVPGLALAQSGQADYDPALYILDLVPEVRDIKGLSLDVTATTAGLSDDARKLIEQNQDISMRESDEGIVLSVASDILFAFDSDALSPKAKTTLKDLATIIKSAPQGTVKVVGHTDAKGTDAYNQSLSEARARSVTDFLRTLGVEPGRLAPEGRGESQPVAPNEIEGKENPEGRARNRRVEFVLPRQ